MIATSESTKVQSNPELTAAMKEIAALLRRTTGLEVELVGAWAVERAISDRIERWRQNGQQVTPASYAQALQADALERQTLVEAIVVPETWFFRHKESYGLVAEIARNWLASQSTPLGSTVMRLASLPCSTGEEPYSLAMALLDAGLRPGSFTIDAVDISDVSIDSARNGVYRRNAFRGDDLAYRGRYFQSFHDGWRISDVVKQCVTYRRGNLVDDSAYRTPGFYDIIFCRNVLIYFDQPTQLAVVHRLRDGLRDGGTLFVGPAESSIATKAGLQPSPTPLAFAFRRPRVIVDSASAASLAAQRPSLLRPPPAGATPLKGLLTASPARTLTPSKQAGVAPNPFARSLNSPGATGARASTISSVRSSVVLASSASVATPARASSPAGDGVLSDAEALANQGRFADAEAMCRRLLDKGQASADLYALLGTIADATGQADAALTHFRRAIYMDGNHANALMQLAGHLALVGDEAGAERLLTRARRARPDLF